MAISAPTELAGAHTHVLSSGTTLASGSATYTSGRLYLAFFGGSGTTLRTNTSVAGVSGTWTELPAGDSNYSDGTVWNVSCFYATDATGTGAITVTYSGSWSASRFAHVFEVASGFDTSGMIVQSVNGNTLPTATSATLNLANSGAAGNLRLGYFVHRVQEALTAGNSGTKVGEQQTASPGAVKALWYYDGNTTSDPNVTWSTNSRGAIYTGAEIKASAGGSTLDVSCTIAMSATESAGAINVMGAGATIAMSLSDTPVGTEYLAGSTTVASTATLTPAAINVAAGSATIAASATLTPTAIDVLAGSTTIAGSATLTPAPIDVLAGVATIASSATLTPTPVEIMAASCTIAAGSSLTPTAALAFGAAVTIAASVGVASAPVALLAAVVSIDALAALLAAATIPSSSIPDHPQGATSQTATRATDRARGRALAALASRATDRISSRGGAP